MPASSAVLTIRCGEDYSVQMTYEVSGTPTQVTDPVLEIRQGPDSSYPLILRLDSTHYMSQASPGVINVLIPNDVTSALPPGTWYWDMFGVVDGIRLKLADTSRVNVDAAVSLAVDD